jgi:hypothetical protein
MSPRPSYCRITKKEFKYASRSRMNIYAPKPLHNRLIAKAKRKGWSLSRMVVHLCEASIEGIE